MARLSLTFGPILAILAAAAPMAARAGEAACRFEKGVIVVPAEVAGIGGEYILDTGAAQTALHETKAEAEGISETALSGDVRLAGIKVVGQALTVEDLDVRTWNLPTAVAGVIGADVLKAFVLDVDFAPCRIRLFLPGRAPPFGGTALPMSLENGRPAVEAAASDGVREVRGPFVVATGANVPVRLADDLADAPGASRPSELYPDGVWLAKLASLTFAGLEQRNLGAGLMKPEGDVAGMLGGAALSRFRLRFDFPAGRLVVARAR